jgi:hypothetical protein
MLPGSVRPCAGLRVCRYMKQEADVKRLLQFYLAISLVLIVTLVFVP